MDVLSSIKLTIGVNKLMKILSTNVKKRLNNTKCGTTRPDLAERLSIQVSVTPNIVESGEISQTQTNVVPQCNRKRPFLKVFLSCTQSFL